MTTARGSSGTKKSVAAKEMAAKKAEHERAKNIKEKVFELEKDNLSKLIIFSSTGGWYKIGGRSALFFYYDIAARVGLSVKLQTDRDFYSKFDYGVISIKNLNSLVLKLGIINIKLLEDQSTSDILIYKLPKPYSQDDIQRLENVEKVKHDEYNQIVKVVDRRPKYYSELRQLLKKVYEFIRKSDSMVRLTLGKDLVLCIENAMIVYLKYSRGDVEGEIFIKKSIGYLQGAIDIITVLMELHISSIDFSIGVARSLVTSLDDIKKMNMHNQGNIDKIQNKNVRDIETYGDALEYAKKS